MDGRKRATSRTRKTGKKTRVRNDHTGELPGLDFESKPEVIPKKTRFAPSQKTKSLRVQNFGNSQAIEKSAMDDARRALSRRETPSESYKPVSWWRWHTLGGVDPDFALFWPVRLVLSIALILTSGISLVAIVKWWLQVIQAEGFWSRPQTVFPLLGVAVFFSLLLVARRAVSTVYVFAHEMTHVAFSYLTGGEARDDLHVTSSGGCVTPYKANFLVTLSPYFFPAYTIVVVGTFGMASLLIDLNLEIILGVRLVDVVYLFVGMTMAMHLLFTVYMLLRGQSDVTMQGWIFSLLVIFQVNVLVVAALLGVADPVLGLRGYLREWVEVAEQCIRFGRDFISIRSATGL